MNGKKIRIIKKNDEYSLEYQIGDIFTIDSTWYGGANVTSKAGIPLSLDKDEYEILKEEQEEKPQIHQYSYQLGVMDAFCEMVSSGMKTLAMSHPCDTKEERDSYYPAMKEICEKYHVKYYAEDQPFLTALFPERMNRDKFNYLFYRSDDVLEEYFRLKGRKEDMVEEGIYEGENRLKIARAFGRLLSYPETGIMRLIEEAAKEEQE